MTFTFPLQEIDFAHNPSLAIESLCTLSEQHSGLLRLPLFSPQRSVFDISVVATLLIYRLYLLFLRRDDICKGRLLFKVIH